MRRKHLIVGLVTVALVAVGAMAITLARPVPFTERVNGLREGMTEDEVRAILGPPGNHSLASWFPFRHGGWPSEAWISEWLWEDEYASVWFGDHGRAKFIYFAAHEPPPILDRFHARLGL
jgi:hypothetical protein